jgi:xanthine dehydrogenase accessory factor
VQLETLATSIGAVVVSRTPGDRLVLHQPPAGVEVDDWTAIVLLFHDHEWEAEILPWALTTPAFYVGSIGGKTTRANRRIGLQKRGFDARSIARVRSPLGLIPSARDPATLALSALAEVVAEYEQLRRAEPSLTHSDV